MVWRASQLLVVATAPREAMAAPTKPSRWGSFLSQAVAGVEARLDNILADNEDAAKGQKPSAPAATPSAPPAAPAAPATKPSPGTPSAPTRFTRADFEMLMVVMCEC